MKSKILLIEDDPTIRQMINDIIELKKLNLELIPVSSAEEGLRIIKTTKIAIVLLDMKLSSVMQGSDFLDELKKLKIKTKVIIETASQSSVKQELLTKYSGLVIEVLLKPFRPSVLVELITKSLNSTI
ncbi:MAG TPA: response regulator [Candidatus Nanoarchaeia archaeon]|nr:response regulator [Candidatus Nanoarchaeia archaeon]